MTIYLPKGLQVFKSLTKVISYSKSTFGSSKNQMLQWTKVIPLINFLTFRLSFFHQHFVEISRNIVAFNGGNVLNPFNLKIVFKQPLDLFFCEMVPSWSVLMTEAY